MAIRKLNEKNTITAANAVTSDMSRFDFQRKLTEEFENLKAIAIEESIALIPAYISFPFDFILKLNVNNIHFPSLFLLDNGNIRALWREGQSQIGLQFLQENKIIQYVLMKEQTEELNTCYGRVQSEHILKLVQSMDLESLLYAKR